MYKAILGSRSLCDYTLIEKSLLEYIKNEQPETIGIISGGVVGTDTLSKQFTEKRNYTIENSDIVFAFWDIKSKERADSIAKARKFGKRIIIIDIHHEQNEHIK